MYASDFVSFSLFSSSACVTEHFTISDVEVALAFIALLTRFTEVNPVCFGFLAIVGVAGMPFLCPASDWDPRTLLFVC